MVSDLVMLLCPFAYSYVFTVVHFFGHLLTLNIRCAFFGFFSKSELFRSFPLFDIKHSKILMASEKKILINHKNIS